MLKPFQCQVPVYRANALLRFITLYYALLRFITLYYALLRLNASFLITLADTGQTHTPPPQCITLTLPSGIKCKDACLHG